jgi:hypothetical protein
MPVNDDDGMSKYGVELDPTKVKTSSEQPRADACPLCGKELDNGGSCPVHGTKPCEPQGPRK